MDTVRIVEIRQTRKPGPLRAFVDIGIEGLLLKDFRVYQSNGKPSVRNPFVSYKNKNGELTFRQIVDLPPVVQAEVNALILEAYFRRTREQTHDRQSQ
jgi:hypothetical protein